MTEDSGAFLARWSKRKLQARGVPDAEVEVRQEPAALAEQPADDEPEIALADLPPIDSIDASTDLTPWLRKKVPEAWKQAALSRAWAADPAIRNFTGLADYAWDWNAVDGVPGFGPLRASDNVAQLLAQAIGQVTQTLARASDAETGMAEAGESAPPEIPPPAQTEAALPKKMPDEPLPFDVAGIPGEPIEATADASPDEPGRQIRRRRGGGALPA